jgi:dienelactone hydrolase
MKRRLLVWLVLALSATAAFGRGAQGRLVGRVVGLSHGARHEEIDLRLAREGDGTQLSAVVDASGVFRFDELAAGEYLLSASHPAGLGAERYVTVYGGNEETPTELRLARPGAAAVASLLWAVLVMVLGLGCGGAIFLYGRVQEQPRPVPWGARPRRRRHERWERGAPAVLAVSIWIAAFSLFRLLAPEMQPMLLAAAGPLTAISASLLTASVLAVLVNARPSTRVALWLLGGGALLAVVARLGPQVESLAQLSPLANTLCWLGMGLGLLLWTGAAGWLVSLGLKRPSYVLLAALVGAVLDIYMVFFGRTGEVVAAREGAGRLWVDLGTLGWPVLGSDRFYGVVGAGDFVFLALFLAAAQRFGFGLVRNIWAQLAALSTGFLVAHTLVLLLPELVGLPALPFMAAFLLMANRGRFETTPTDRRHIAAVLGVLLLACSALGARRLARQPVGREEVNVELAGETAAPNPVRVPWAADKLRQPGLGARALPAAAGDGPALARFEYVAEVIGDRPVIVRGALARPSGAGPWPAVLVLHDSAETADLAEARAWAARGCLGVVFDANPRRDPFDSDLAAWPSTVPLSHDADLRDSLLYHHGVAALRAVQYLDTRPEASGELVLVGRGQGAVVALALVGLVPTAKALVLERVGALDQRDGGKLAGFVGARPSAVRDALLAAFGPERHAARVRQAVLVVAASNDPDWALPAASRVYGQLPRGRRRLVIAPNADHGLGAPATEMVARFVAAALGQAPETIAQPALTVTGEDNRLLLTCATSLSGVAGVTFHVATDAVDDPRGWPGRYWAAIPGRRLGAEWVARIGLAPPAASIAVWAQVTAEDGSVAATPLWEQTPTAARVRLGPAVWCDPVLGAFRAGAGGWRAAESGDTVTWRAPGYLELGSAAVTNRVDALRRIGGLASALLVEVDAGPAARELSLQVVERWARAGEQRWAVAARTTAGRGWVEFPLRGLRPLSGGGAGRTPAWERVDALVLRADTGPAWRLHHATLTAGGGGAVWPVTP